MTAADAVPTTEASLFVPSSATTGACGRTTSSAGSCTSPPPPTTASSAAGEQGEQRTAAARRRAPTSTRPRSSPSAVTAPGMSAPDPAALAAERERLRAAYLRPAGERPPSSARGLHHTALVSGDVERTTRFYSELLEFPLTEMIDNRDYPGSTHFFFDIGNGNLLAFFDFPGLDNGPYAEVLGGLHHVAISVEPDRWAHLRAKLDDAGRRVRPPQRHVAVLHRPRRRAARADLRPARRDVRRAGPLAGQQLASSRRAAARRRRRSSGGSARRRALGSPECVDGVRVVGEALAATR